MRSLTTLAVVVGFLVQFITCGALAAGGAALASTTMDANAAMSSRIEAALQTPASLGFAKRACRRRAALKMRDFVKEQLSPLPRPIGYLVSQVGVTRWLQSLQLVPAMIANNAAMIQTHAPHLAQLLANLGSGSVVDGLADLVKKVGPVTVGPAPSAEALLAFLELGGDNAKLAVESCVVSYRLTTTPLQREACNAYDTTGEAGLKLLAIKLFTNTVRASPIGAFAVQYGGLHGLAARDAAFTGRLSSIVASSRLGALMARVGGFSRILADLQQGAHGLESISWALFGPKLLEKASHCAGGDGGQYVPPRMWTALGKLARDTALTQTFPASKHYTYQFWLKPGADFARLGGNLLRHGASSTVAAPAISACADARGVPGLAITVDGRNGTKGGIACSNALPVNECTFVTVTHRDGNLQLFYNDALVQETLVRDAVPVAGPVYFSDPWAAAADAEVMPVSVLARAVTRAEIAASIGATQHACPSTAFPAPLRARFSAVREAELSALSEVASSVRSTLDASVAADSASNSAASSAAEAELSAAQKDICLMRFRSLSIRKLATALAKSPIAAEFNTHGSTVRTFLAAGAAGKYDPAALDAKLANTHIGAALARVGGLKAVVEAFKAPAGNADTWAKVQALVMQMGGGKVELALDRCGQRSGAVLSDAAALDKQGCEVVTRWGRASLPSYAVKLFEQALAASRIGHLYTHYGSLLGLATALRSNKDLEGKAALLFAGSEAGQLLAPHGGLSAAFTAVLEGPGPLHALLWTAFSPKLAPVADRCAAALGSPAEQRRAVCRQRVVRRATYEFLGTIPQTPLAPLLGEFSVLDTASTAAVTANVSTASGTLTALAGVPWNRVFALDERVAGSPLATMLAPMGGVPALAAAARTSLAALQNFVWTMNKLALLPAVEACERRSERESTYVEACRRRVNDVYTGRFSAEVAKSAIAPFASKFGGFAALARHDPALLTRLAKLTASQPIAERFRYLGGLNNVFASVAQDPNALEAYLITDMYGATAQAALGHCEDHAATAAVASTASFMVSLKEKLTAPAFKRILDRALLAARNPLASSPLAQELVRLGGLQGLMVAASEGRDEDVAAFVAERLGTPLASARINGFVSGVGGATGLRALTQASHDMMSKTLAVLECEILSSTWLKGYLDAVGGCLPMMEIAGRPNAPDALDELAQKRVQRLWIETGLLPLTDGTFQAAVLTGTHFEPLLRQVIVGAFSAQHGDSAHAAHFSEMFGKILGKIETPRSFLESGASASSKAGAKGKARYDPNDPDPLKKPVDDDYYPTTLTVEAIGNKDVLEHVLRLKPGPEFKPGDIMAMDIAGGVPIVDPVAAYDDSPDVMAIVAGMNKTNSTVQAPANETVPAKASMTSIASVPNKVINDVPARCPNQCSARGKCVQNTGKSLLSPSGTAYIHPYECICDPGWTGTGCEIYIDQYVRWLLSKGRYGLPKCCPTCKSQSNPLPEARWVPAASANAFPVDPKCAHPEWISDRQRRAECIRSALATRQRVVPSPDIRAANIAGDDTPTNKDIIDLSFVELSTAVTARTSEPKSFSATLFENYAARTNADLKSVEAAFDVQFAEAVRPHAEARAAEEHSRLALLESGSGPTPRAGSAAAKFPVKTAAQLQAEHDSRYTSAFNKAYSLVESKESDQPGVSVIGEQGSSKQELKVATEVIVQDTSSLFTPTPLDEIHVPECCIPCDHNPQKDPEPKFVPTPEREKSIVERLSDNPPLPHTKDPYEIGIATKLSTGREDGQKFKRRGAVERANSWAARVANPMYNRRSNSPLPSEMSIKRLDDQDNDDEQCCTICPFKHVRGIFDKSGSTAVSSANSPDGADGATNVTPASFLELDAQFLSRSEDNLYSFIEESLTLVLRDDALPSMSAAEIDALARKHKPTATASLESLLDGALDTPAFPSLAATAEDVPVSASLLRAAKVARAIQRDFPESVSLLETSATTTATATAGAKAKVQGEPFPDDPKALPIEKRAEMIVQRQMIEKYINSTKPNCVNGTEVKKVDPPKGKGFNARLARMDIWLRSEKQNSTISAQAALSDWLTKLERKRTQTMPPTPAWRGVDLSTNVNHVNVPFVPRPDKKQAPCCDMCPSVFVLRQFPHNPWEEGPGPAFEILN